MKYTICVDLDATLAQYDGWKGVTEIGDPFPGAAEFMASLKAQYNVVVYTTRTNLGINCAEVPVGTDCKEYLIGLIEAWLTEHKIPFDSVFAGQGKPLFTALVDDRAVSCQPAANPNAYDEVLKTLNCKRLYGVANG
jgi:hypothetical protein